MPAQESVAIVTGAGKGIGRAIATRLAQDGIAVAVWDRNDDAAGETADAINGAGGRAVTCIGDSSGRQSIDDLASRTRSLLGPVTILVNNAGRDVFSEFEAISEDELDRMLSANVKGPFFCAQAVIGDMLAAGWGRIINISSSSAQAGAPRISHYAASKAAIVGLTKALAIEYARRGITINSISPSMIDTPMLRRVPFDFMAVANRNPIKRVGRPEEIAAACAYLVSEDAGYVTGQTLNVNGGMYLT
jgi:2-hydroxycyclohexanecarboxyl-CoA dehydrogenase